MYYSATYPSPIGLITIASTEDALVGLWIEGQKYFSNTIKDPLVERPDLPILIETRQWLDRYFAGEQPSLTELKLAPIGGEFRQSVWSILCEIPYGQVITYGDIAKRIAAAKGIKTCPLRQSAEPWATIPSPSSSPATASSVPMAHSPGTPAGWNENNIC